MVQGADAVAIGYDGGQGRAVWVHRRSERQPSAAFGPLPGAM